MRFFILLFVLFITACSTRPTEHTANFYDPFETPNREAFAFNAELDSITLEPIAKGYNTLPSGLRASFTNHVQWLGQPTTVVNSTLQGRLENAGLAMMNFLVNGLSLGFADLTGDEDNPEPTDFGMTLAKWSVAEGSYLTLPIFGPGTARQQTGRLIDSITNPFNRTNLAKTALPIGAITARADNFDQINALKYQSADPYAKTRSLYYQYRRGKIKNLIGDQSDDNSDSDTLFDDFLDQDENGDVQ